MQKQKKTESLGPSLHRLMGLEPMYAPRGRTSSPLNESPSANNFRPKKRIIVNREEIESYPKEMDWYRNPPLETRAHTIGAFSVQLKISFL